MDFEVWMYRGSIVILLSILWYLAKGVLKELKLIRGALQALNLSQARQDGKIEVLTTKVSAHESRLNDHSHKIRDVERKQDACPNCKK